MNKIAGASGISFSGLLTIVFIILKLTGTIDWPWWSFNPFQASVLILWVLSFWLIIFSVVIFIAFVIADSFKDKIK